MHCNPNDLADFVLVLSCSYSVITNTRRPHRLSTISAATGTLRNSQLPNEKRHVRTRRVLNCVWARYRFDNAMVQHTFGNRHDVFSSVEAFSSEHKYFFFSSHAQREPIVRPCYFKLQHVETDPKMADRTSSIVRSPIHHSRTPFSLFQPPFREGGKRASWNIVESPCVKQRCRWIWCLKHLATNELNDSAQTKGEDKEYVVQFLVYLLVNFGNW